MKIEMKIVRSVRVFALPLLVAALQACSHPQPGPDKTLAGAVLGAGWGAGTGAVIGNQTGRAGEGVAIGSGFGLVAGAATGLGYDYVEDTQAQQEAELASLKVQNLSNTRQIAQLQTRLDRAAASEPVGGVHQVYFDSDATSLKAGSLANLEVIAESLKSGTRGYWINVVGHSDDSGNPEYNARLAEARARTVSAYLAQRGLSLDRIKVESYGSTRPIASNSSAVGRQLNRRVDVFVTHQ